MSARLPTELKRILVVLAVCTLLFIPAMIKGIPRGNDLPHHYRTAVSFYEVVQSGSLYPGWNPLSTSGYGDVSFRFYPPATYYILAISRTLAGGWYSGSLLTFVLLSVLGALGAYLWARPLLPGYLPLWAAIFYTLAPYHVNEIYQAFLLPEYAGSAVLPFCFAFVQRVCRQGRARDIAGLAASYALLILTHLPLAVIGSLALLFYAVILIGRTDIRRRLIRLSASVVLGLAASARYWVTVVSELQWLKGDSSPWYDYRFNFLFWESVEGSTSWWANLIAVTSLLFFLPGILFLFGKSGRSSSASRRIAVLMLFSFLMTTPISRPLWDVVPGLKQVEFPWRWLAVTSVAGSIALASSIPYWLEKKRGPERPLALLACACLLIPLALTTSQTIRGAAYIPRAKFDSLIEGVAGSKSLVAWLPTWANYHVRPMKGEVETKSRDFSVLSWESYNRSFRVDPGQVEEARVRTFYYPHWIATANGQELSTRPDDDGALLISLPSSEAEVNLEFREPRRILGATVITLIGWIIISTFLFVPGLRPGFLTLTFVFHCVLRGLLFVLSSLRTSLR